MHIREIEEALISGSLDAELDTILYKVRARKDQLALLKAQSLKINDRVKINYTVRPKYLQGYAGRVIGFPAQGKIMVRLDNKPHGRFSQELMCPPSILDRE